MNFDKEKAELKLSIDENARTLYTDERKLNKFQLNEKLFFITNSLWDSFQNVLIPIRQKIQGLESEILVNRYKLDETLKKHCESKEDFKRSARELFDVEENLDSHRKEMQKIEAHCNAEEAEGDLKRLPMWLFWLLMFFVGLAEVSVYYYVFLSQEIGLKTEITSSTEEYIYYGLAMIMAVGFTIMLIWLSHKLGMMLRQYISVHKKSIKSYWIKFGAIAFIVIAAIVSTVIMRAQMHNILYIEHQIEQLQKKNLYSPGMSMGDINSVYSNSMMDGDNKNDESVMSEEVVMGDDEMTDDMMMSSEGDMEHKPNPITRAENMDKNTSEIVSESSLREAINLKKGTMAYLFIIINIFIVVAGIFLSYEVHTSSIKYEALEGMITRLEKRRKTLSKKKRKLENELLKNEKGELLSVVTKFVDSVNRFDEYSQKVKSYKIYIENVYIEMVYYMFGTMIEHKLLVDIDEKFIEEYTPEYLSVRFNKEWKLEKIDVDVPEVIHANNIDEYLELFKCQDKKDQIGGIDSIQNEVIEEDMVEIATNDVLNQEKEKTDV